MCSYSAVGFTRLQVSINPCKDIDELFTALSEATFGFQCAILSSFLGSHLLDP